MTKRIATSLTVLAATLVLAAPAAISASADGSTVNDARNRAGCC